MPRKKKNVQSDDLFEQFEGQKTAPDSADDTAETNVGSVEGQDVSSEAETESESTPHITAEMFALFRENMRKVSDDTSKLCAELANVLCFVDSGKWKPFLRYAMCRDDGSESAITIYCAPCGLYTAQAILTSDRVNDDMEHETLRYPDVDMAHAAAEAGIDSISVYDEAELARRGIYTPLCNSIGKNLAFGVDTLDWLADVFMGNVEPVEVLEEEEPDEGPDEEDIPTAATYKSGEQTELDPEVFPSFRVWETPGKKKIIEQLNSVNAALKSNEEDLKELKESQKNAFKNEMDQKKCCIEMFGKLADYYSILKALEDARYESSVGDAVFAAFTTPEVKGKWVHVGTGQDISDARLKYGSAYVFVVAEFKGGLPVGNGDEDELDEQDEEQAEKHLVSVWQCPAVDGDGNPSEAITAADETTAKTSLKCGEHDYCDGCEGPENIGDAEVDEEQPETDDPQNGVDDTTLDPEITAQRPQEGGKLEKEAQEYPKDKDDALTGEIDAFDEYDGEDTPEDDGPEGARAA